MEQFNFVCGVGVSVFDLFRCCFSFEVVCSNLDMFVSMVVAVEFCFWLDP